jgi:hypothetical protein
MAACLMATAIVARLDRQATSASGSRGRSSRGLNSRRILANNTVSALIGGFI